MPERIEKLWAKRPLFFLALGLVILVAISHFLPSFLWFFGIIYLALCLRLGGWSSAALSFLVASFCLGNLHWRDIIQAKDEIQFSQKGISEVEAILLEDAQGNEGTWSALARIKGSDSHGKNVQWIGHGKAPSAGTQLLAHGVFEPLKPERNPGVPERAKHLRNEGVVAIFRSSAMRSQSWMNPFSRVAASFRTQFREGMSLGLAPESEAAKVIRAIVIGERAQEALGLVRKYRESGTLHIFSVSGMHVVMIGSLVWFLLRRLRVPRRAAIPLIVLAMFGYSWLSGNGPAALRAAWMATMFLGAFLFRRRPDLLNTLGCVLILSLMFEPRMIRMTGVQLSYGVVAAIGIGTSWTKSLLKTKDQTLYLPQSEKSLGRLRWERFCTKLRDSFLVSATASLGSLPLSFFHLGVIAPISAIATVVLIPFVYVILTLGLLASLLSPFSQKATIFLNQINQHVANQCTATAGFFAHLPGASGSLSRAYRDSLLIYDLPYASACACFTSQRGNSILLDTGGSFALKREIGSSLSHLGLRPDTAFFSHHDAGHSAPLALLQEMFPMKQVLGEKPSTKQKLDESGIRFLEAKKGQRIDFGDGVWGELLWVQDQHKKTSLADDRSILLRLHWHGWKILFTSDAGRSTEEAILKEGIDPSADIIVASLHEREPSLSEAFLTAVNPQAIILPRASGQEMSAYRNQQKNLWQQRGFLLIHQEKTGGLTVKRLTSGELKISGFVDGSERVFQK